MRRERMDASTSIIEWKHQRIASQASALVHKECLRRVFAKRCEEQHHLFNSLSTRSLRTLDDGRFADRDLAETLGKREAANADYVMTLAVIKMTPLPFG